MAHPNTYETQGYEWEQGETAGWVNRPFLPMCGSDLLVWNRVFGHLVIEFPDTFSNCTPVTN